MFIISRLRHGVTAACVPENRTAPPPDITRGNVDGWSNKACARNASFLRSVDETHLTGIGAALTLTLLTCPKTHDEWHRLRLNIIEFMRRRGLIRCHWVVEWQRRGVPHLHIAAYFDHGTDAMAYALVMQEIIDHWLKIAAPFGARSRGQTAKTIFDAVGWFQYSAKHASRGVAHYQRSPDCQPAHWEKTGRVWGKCGEWPTCDPERLEVSNRAFWAFRRIARAWRLADARSAPQRTEKERKARLRRIKSARRSLRCTHRDKSDVRGVSEWIPGQMQTQIVDHLASSGYRIRPAEKPTVRMLAPRIQQSPGIRALRSAVRIRDEHEQIWMDKLYQASLDR